MAVPNKARVDISYPVRKNVVGMYELPPKETVAAAMATLNSHQLNCMMIDVDAVVDTLMRTRAALQAAYVVARKREKLNKP